MANQHPSNTWTRERVDLLKKLWNEGLSASHIAARLGDPITRNSVLGKAHRLGIVVKGARTTHYFNKNKDRLPISNSLERAIVGRRLFKMETGERAHADRALVRHLTQTRSEDKARKALLDLEAGDCRYVVGDDLKGVCFCALPRVPGLSYCATHVLRTYRNADVVLQNHAPASVKQSEDA